MNESTPPRIQAKEHTSNEVPNMLSLTKDMIGKKNKQMVASCLSKLEWIEEVEKGGGSRDEME